MSLQSINIEEPDNLDIYQKLDNAYQLFVKFYNEYENFKSDPKDILDGYCVYVLLFIIDYFFGNNKKIINLDYESKNNEIVNIITYTKSEKDNSGVKQDIKIKENVKFILKNKGHTFFNVSKDKPNNVYNIIMNIKFIKDGIKFKKLCSIYYTKVNVNQKELNNGIFYFFMTGIYLYPYVLNKGENKTYTIIFNGIYKKELKLIFQDNFIGQLPNIEITQGFKWYNNSCFLDSLLVMLLFSVETKFRDIFFNYNFNKNEYKNIVFCKGKNLDDNELEEYYNKVKNSLKTTFDSIVFNNKIDTVKCSNIRNILGECKKVISSGGFDSLTGLYELIVNIFPKLRIMKEQYINLGDYLNPNQDFDFSSLNEDFIVFNNDTTILDVNNNITIYYKKLNEENDVADIYETGMLFPKTKPLEKEIELNDIKYKLIGVIIHEDQTHYVLYFKPLWNIGNFYYYDDMKDDGKFKKVDELKDDDIFSVTNNKIPELYFYQKVNK